MTASLAPLPAGSCPRLHVQLPPSRVRAQCHEPCQPEPPHLSLHLSSIKWGRRELSPPGCRRARSPEPGDCQGPTSWPSGLSTAASRAGTQRSGRCLSGFGEQHSPREEEGQGGPGVGATESAGPGEPPDPAEGGASHSQAAGSCSGQVGQLLAAQGTAGRPEPPTLSVLTY